MEKCRGKTPRKKNQTKQLVVVLERCDAPVNSAVTKAAVTPRLSPRVDLVDCLSIPGSLQCFPSAFSSSSSDKRGRGGEATVPSDARSLIDCCTDVECREMEAALMEDGVFLSYPETFTPDEDAANSSPDGGLDAPVAESGDAADFDMPLLMLEDGKSMEEAELLEKRKERRSECFLNRVPLFDQMPLLSIEGEEEYLNHDHNHSSMTDVGEGLCAVGTSFLGEFPVDVFSGLNNDVMLGDVGSRWVLQEEEELRVTSGCMSVETETEESVEFGEGNFVIDEMEWNCEQGWPLIDLGGTFSEGHCPLNSSMDARDSDDEFTQKMREEFLARRLRCSTRLKNQQQVNGARSSPDPEDLSGVIDGEESLRVGISDDMELMKMSLRRLEAESRDRVMSHTRQNGFPNETQVSVAGDTPHIDRKSSNAEQKSVKRVRHRKSSVEEEFSSEGRSKSRDLTLRRKNTHQLSSESSKEELLLSVKKPSRTLLEKSEECGCRMEEDLMEERLNIKTNDSKTLVNRSAVNESKLPRTLLNSIEAAKFKYMELKKEREAREANVDEKQKKIVKDFGMKALCREQGCSSSALCDSIFCSSECLSHHVKESLKLLAQERLKSYNNNRAKMLELSDASRQTERIVVFERKTGKLVTGPLAPTESTLLAWLQRHPTFEVLQPGQAFGSSSKNSRRRESHGEAKQRRDRRSSSSSIRAVEKVNKGQKRDEPLSKNSIRKEVELTDGSRKMETVAESGSLRVKTRSEIHRLLLMRLEKELSAAQGKWLASEIEVELWLASKGASSTYRQKASAVTRAFKRPSSQDLCRRLLCAEVKPKQFLLNPNSFLKSDAITKSSAVQNDKRVDRSGMLPSLSDTTDRHGDHVFDVSCRICTGRNHPTSDADSCDVLASPDLGCSGLPTSGEKDVYPGSGAERSGVCQPPEERLPMSANPLASDVPGSFTSDSRIRSLTNPSSDCSGPSTSPSHLIEPTSTLPAPPPPPPLPPLPPPGCLDLPHTQVPPGQSSSSAGSRNPDAPAGSAHPLSPHLSSLRLDATKDLPRPCASLINSSNGLHPPEPPPCSKDSSVNFPSPVVPSRRFSRDACHASTAPAVVVATTHPSGSSSDLLHHSVKHSSTAAVPPHASTDVPLPSFPAPMITSPVTPSSKSRLVDGATPSATSRTVSDLSSPDALTNASCSNRGPRAVGCGETLVDMVWRGSLSALDGATVQLCAYRLHGSMRIVKSVLPLTLTMMGRIPPATVKDYLMKIQDQYATTREIAIVCFRCHADGEKVKYNQLFSYLQERRRCGVIGSIGTAIKDMYIWPLAAAEAFPLQLLPSGGPGLEVSKSNVLLGIVVQQVRPRNSVTSATLGRIATSGQIPTQQQQPSRLNSGQRKDNAFVVDSAEEEMSDDDDDLKADADPIVSKYSKVKQEDIVLATREKEEDDNDDDEKPYDPFEEDYEMSLTDQVPLKMAAKEILGKIPASVEITESVSQEPPLVTTKMVLNVVPLLENSGRLSSQPVEKTLTCRGDVGSRTNRGRALSRSGLELKPETESVANLLKEQVLDSFLIKTGSETEKNRLQTDEPKTSKNSVRIEDLQSLETLPAEMEKRRESATEDGAVLSLTDSGKALGNAIGNLADGISSSIKTICCSGNHPSEVSEVETADGVSKESGSNASEADSQADQRKAEARSNVESIATILTELSLSNSLNEEILRSLLDKLMATSDVQTTLDQQDILLNLVQSIERRHVTKELIKQSPDLDHANEVIKEVINKAPVSLRANQMERLDIISKEFGKEVASTNANDNKLISAVTCVRSGSGQLKVKELENCLDQRNESAFRGATCEAQRETPSRQRLIQSARESLYSNMDNLFVGSTPSTCIGRQEAGLGADFGGNSGVRSGDEEALPGLGEDRTPLQEMYRCSNVAEDVNINGTTGGKSYDSLTSDAESRCATQTANIGGNFSALYQMGILPAWSAKFVLQPRNEESSDVRRSSPDKPELLDEFWSSHDAGKSGPSRDSASCQPSLLQSSSVEERRMEPPAKINIENILPILSDSSIKILKSIVISAKTLGSVGQREVDGRLSGPTLSTYGAMSSSCGGMSSSSGDSFTSFPGPGIPRPLRSIDEHPVYASRNACLGWLPAPPRPPPCLLSDVRFRPPALEHFSSIQPPNGRMSVFPARQCFEYSHSSGPKNENARCAHPVDSRVVNSSDLGNWPSTLSSGSVPLPQVGVESSNGGGGVAEEIPGDGYSGVILCQHDRDGFQGQPGQCSGECQQLNRPSFKLEVPHSFPGGEHRWKQVTKETENIDAAFTPCSASGARRLPEGNLPSLSASLSSSSHHSGFVRGRSCLSDDNLLNSAYWETDSPENSYEFFGRAPPDDIRDLLPGIESLGSSDCPGVAESAVGLETFGRYDSAAVNILETQTAAAAESRLNKDSQTNTWSRFSVRPDGQRSSLDGGLHLVDEAVTRERKNGGCTDLRFLRGTTDSFHPEIGNRYPAGDGTGKRKRVECSEDAGILPPFRRCKADLERQVLHNAKKEVGDFGSQMFNLGSMLNHLASVDVSEALSLSVGDKTHRYGSLCDASKALNSPSKEIASQYRGSLESSCSRGGEEKLPSDGGLDIPSLPRSCSPQGVYRHEAYSMSKMNSSAGVDCDRRNIERELVWKGTRGSGDMFEALEERGSSEDFAKMEGPSLGFRDLRRATNCCDSVDGNLRKRRSDSQGSGDSSRKWRRISNDSGDSRLRHHRRDSCGYLRDGFTHRLSSEPEDFEERMYLEQSHPYSANERNIRTELLPHSESRNWMVDSGIHDGRSQMERHGGISKSGRQNILENPNWDYTQFDRHQYPPSLGIVTARERIADDALDHGRRPGERRSQNESSDRQGRALQERYCPEVRENPADFRRHQLVFKPRPEDRNSDVNLSVADGQTRFSSHSSLRLQNETRARVLQQPPERHMGTWTGSEAGDRKAFESGILADFDRHRKDDVESSKVPEEEAKASEGAAEAWKDSSGFRTSQGKQNRSDDSGIGKTGKKGEQLNSSETETDTENSKEVMHSLKPYGVFISRKKSSCEPPLDDLEEGEIVEEVGRARDFLPKATKELLRYLNTPDRGLIGSLQPRAPLPEGCSRLKNT